MHDLVHEFSSEDSTEVPQEDQQGRLGANSVRKPAGC